MADLDLPGRVHFVGVGGHSMSGLAAALAVLGRDVSGSDVALSPRTERIAAQGVRVDEGHDGARVRALPAGALVVYTTDVPPDNPEMVAARSRGLPVAHRSAVLEWFVRGGHLGRPGQPAVAVTGTHGKTTTTALCGLALLSGGLDPTIFVGADVPYLADGNFRVGRGPVVVEADESDGTFVRYRPSIAVVTNMAPEHLEHYGGQFENVRAAYRDFIAGAAALALLCGDDAPLRALGAHGPVAWYGTGSGNGLRGRIARLEARSDFSAAWGGEDLGAFALAMPGEHNVRNALAAVGVARRLGADMDAVRAGLAGFRGAARRFQVLCGPPCTVVDDYAHNPAKVAAAIAAARLLRPSRLVAVFQPHRYQRTQQLWDGFARAFSGADAVVLTGVYAPAGEPPLPGVDSGALADAMAAGSGVPVRHVPLRQEVPGVCADMARPGDLFLVMGAGDVTLAAAELARRVGGEKAAAAQPAEGFRALPVR